MEMGGGGDEGGQPGRSIGEGSATGFCGRLRHYSIPPHCIVGGPKPPHLHLPTCSQIGPNTFSPSTPDLDICRINDRGVTHGKFGVSFLPCFGTT